MAKPNIWIIDTSVFLNILDVPNFNQDRETILHQVIDREAQGDYFFLPYATIVETGNHIAQIPTNLRYSLAQKFVEQIRMAIRNEVPYKTLKFPEKQDLLEWIADFPANAGRGVGFADSTIIEDWKRQRVLNQGWCVRIWSLDAGLQGYEC